MTLRLLKALSWLSLLAMPLHAKGWGYASPALAWCSAELLFITR